MDYTLRVLDAVLICLKTAKNSESCELLIWDNKYNREREERDRL